MVDNLEKGVDGIGIIQGDDSKYWGKYVAISLSAGREIVAYGKDLVKVSRQATKRVGEGNFFTTPVHDPDEAYAGG